MSALDDEFVNAKNMILCRACGCTHVMFVWGGLIRDRHTCKESDILRTDPERARKMGLGWAL